MKPSIDGAKLVKEMMQHPEPLDIRVLDSTEVNEAEQKYHRIKISIRNATAQGIYLESFVPDKPKGYDVVIERYRRTMASAETTEGFEPTVVLQ